MARNRSRGMRKQQLTTKKAVTRDYQPIMIHHWGVRPRDLPIFTFLSIQAMLYDPTIRLGLAMRAAPVYQTQFGWKEQGQWQEGVQCKNEAVKQFLDRQLQRIWQQDVNLLVKSQLWGHTGGEVMLRLSEDNLVEVDCLLDRHPNDVRALKRGGQNVGVRIARLTNQGAVDMEWPKAYWTTYNPEAGCFYGTSVLIGAYSPWYDKWCDGGALDVRRLYMHKDAYVGCSIYYPEGDLYTMPDGSEVPARDLARQMIEQIVAGGVVALPSDQDEKGNRKWELKPATVASNPAHILKYPQDLDTEMLRGIEVPDDIFTADSTSSGAWAGKKVPLSAFYAGLDSWVVQMTKDLKRCIFEPLVLLNFGKAIDFEIGHKPLAEQAMEQQNQPQGGGQPPGQPGAEGMPGMPGQPGGDEGGGGGGGSLADLLSSPAAQQARQGGGGGQPQQMSLDAAIGRGVVEAAAIVKASRETLDAAMVRMASDTPREGDRNAEGLVFHGSRWHREDELPGAGETKAGGTGAAKTPEAPKPTVSNESHVAAYQGGDKSAAERLLKQNAGLIYSMAKKFAKHFDEMDDLQQEARIAVLHAAKAFDPSRGLQFSTLATRAIINRLSNVSTRAGKRKGVWTQTPEDEEGHQAEPSVKPDQLPMEASEQQATILKAVESLPERTRVIVQRRYGLDGGEPESATAIAERVGLSPQRVAKILDGAKSKLRSALQDYSIQLAIRMAGDSNPWTSYKGPRGGIGWVHGGTGDIRYQTDRPGANETGGSEKAVVAKSAAEQTNKPTAKPHITETPEFKRWFAGSKVVDSDGKPLVVYHGTSSPVEDFNVFRPLSHFGDTDAANVVVDPYQFRISAPDTAVGGASRVYPVYLSIRSPAVIEDSGEQHTVKGMAEAVKNAGHISFTDYEEIILDENGDSRDEQAMLSAFIETLEDQGYDGLAYSNKLEGSGTSYVVFRPEQIKSASGNRGTFDPYDPDIRMAGEVNPWTPYKGKHGGQGWVRSDTKEVRYQKERPGAHEGAPGQQPSVPGKPAVAAETPSAPAPKTPQELESALQAVAADPAAHGLHEEEAAKLQQAKTVAEKIAVLDEATGHKFDKGGATAADGGQPAVPVQAPTAQQPAQQPAAATAQAPTQQSVTPQKPTEAGHTTTKDTGDAKAAAKAAAKAQALEATKHLDDKQLLATLSAKDDPSLYFDTKGAVMLPVEQLHNIRARPGGIANAMRFMYAAAIGKMPKRGPVSVMQTDKGYEIYDGNSTFNIAKQAGWKNLPVKFVNPDGTPAAPSFARHELPQLLGTDKPEFYSLLHDAGIKTELKSVPVGELKGIQRDLNPEKVSSMAATIREKGTLGPWPLLASNDGYIVDGHHRWAAEKEVDPTRKVSVVQADIPVHELIAKLESFPKSFKAGTDEAPRNWQAGQPANPQATATEQPAQPAQPKKFVEFTPDETSLPREVSHPYKTMEAAYAAAGEAKRTFDNALDHGQGVDQAVGGKSVRPTSQQEFVDAMKMPGPIVVIAGIKGQKRAAEKVQQDYNGDWTKLGDMVRATVAVDDVESLGETVNQIRKHMLKQGWKMASAPKDRFSKPTESGYRDVMMKFVGPNGMTAELQVNTKAMILAKEGEGHRLYEQYRSLDGKVRSESREPTSEERATMQKLNKAMEHVYARAWSISQRGVAK